MSRPPAFGKPCRKQWGERHWTDVLRLVAVLGMAYGARTLSRRKKVEENGMDVFDWLIVLVLAGGAAALWFLYRKPNTVTHEGRAYRRDRDGSFRDPAGVPVTDPALLAGACRRARPPHEGPRSPDRRGLRRLKGGGCRRLAPPGVAD